MIPLLRQRFDFIYPRRELIHALTVFIPEAKRRGPARVVNRSAPASAPVSDPLPEVNFFGEVGASMVLTQRETTGFKRVAN